MDFNIENVFFIIKMLWVTVIVKGYNSQGVNKKDLSW